MDEATIDRPDSARDHWQDVYERREPGEVSWFEPVPQASLDWIAKGRRADRRRDPRCGRRNLRASRRAGPTRAHRYSATDLASLLADAFELVDSALVDHPTPGGSTQRFVYAHLRRTLEAAA